MGLDKDEHIHHTLYTRKRILHHRTTRNKFSLVRLEHRQSDAQEKTTEEQDSSNLDENVFRQTDRQTDTQTDRQTDRQSDPFLKCLLHIGESF